MFAPLDDDADMEEVAPSECLRRHSFADIHILAELQGLTADIQSYARERVSDASS